MTNQNDRKQQDFLSFGESYLTKLTDLAKDHGTSPMAELLMNEHDIDFAQMAMQMGTSAIYWGVTSHLGNMELVKQLVDKEKVKEMKEMLIAMTKLEIKRLEDFEV